MYRDTLLNALKISIRYSSRHFRKQIPPEDCKSEGPVLVCLKGMKERNVSWEDCINHFHICISSNITCTSSLFFSFLKVYFQFISIVTRLFFSLTKLMDEYIFLTASIIFHPCLTYETAQIIKVPSNYDSESYIT